MAKVIEKLTKIPVATLVIWSCMLITEGKLTFSQLIIRFLAFTLGIIVAACIVAAIAGFFSAKTEKEKSL
jgi:hypothetical protein